VKAVVLSNGPLGPAEFYLELIEEDDVLICADGGANHAVALGLIPDFVVGDMDSIDTSVLAELSAQGRTELKRVPVEKDESDTELALDVAVDLAPSSIVLTCVLGARFDHALANVGLLARVPAAIPAVIVEPEMSAFLVTDTVSIEGWPGRLVSLLPLFGEARGIDLEGFKYGLTSGVLSPGTTLGLSNVMLGETASVSVEEGALLAVLPDQAAPEPSLDLP